MKLVRHQNGEWVFELSAREKALLLSLVKLFPLAPLAHSRHRVSENTGMAGAREAQRLLDESLKAHREESRQWTARLLEPSRFDPVKSGFHLPLKRAEIEELLQVLNDVRIGSWIALGAPDLETGERLLLNEQTALVHGQRMELAGIFQMFFLQAIGA